MAKGRERILSAVLELAGGRGAVARAMGWSDAKLSKVVNHSPHIDRERQRLLHFVYGRARKALRKTERGK